MINSENSNTNLHEDLTFEQNNLVPSFAELNLEEFDETDDLICQRVQELWEFWQKNECTCRKSKKKTKSCFEKIGFSQFFKRQEECHNMTHNNLDIWIKGQLASFAFNDESSKQKNSQELNNSTANNRVKYRYHYNAQHIVCLPTYLALIGISSSRLDRIKAHIKSNGMAEIFHGNTGRASTRPNRAIIDDQAKQELNNFLRNYANIHGYPSPGRYIRKSTMPIISLPTDTTYTDVYEEYVTTIKSIKGEDYKAMALSTFYQIWNEIAPDIRFLSKASDLCDKCEQLRATVIRNNLSFDPYKPLDTVSLKSLTLKRQTQLFKDIHLYIHDLYKDELCFAPNKNNKDSD
ncbi:14781_t:CDS:2 [Cetraspora pellucida]|uniref:14781_t:CDS:1 n=1 Tax=Cetraspora pellucida TaxID=1433469 RepID=A0A9N8Z2P3_9GLOM|nr:14781_t:CDS:2 [Cetraspora pellucida]